MIKSERGSVTVFTLSACLLMSFILVGIFMLSKFSQLRNALFPILVIVFDNCILVNALHPLNADLPIIVTLLGIVILFNFEQ